MNILKKYLHFWGLCDKIYEHLISPGPYGCLLAEKIDIEADGPLALKFMNICKKLRRKNHGRN